MTRRIGDAFIETVVLASIHDDLQFAAAHEFAEVVRYLLAGDEDPCITLQLH